jgi:hypothetical protein
MAGTPGRNNCLKSSESLHGRVESRGRVQSVDKGNNKVAQRRLTAVIRLQIASIHLRLSTFRRYAPLRTNLYGKLMRFMEDRYITCENCAWRDGGRQLAGAAIGSRITDTARPCRSRLLSSCWAEGYTVSRGSRAERIVDDDTTLLDVPASSV